MLKQLLEILILHTLWVVMLDMLMIRRIYSYTTYHFLFCSKFDHFVFVDWILKFFPQDLRIKVVSQPLLAQGGAALLEPLARAVLRGEAAEVLCEQARERLARWAGLREVALGPEHGVHQIGVGGI